MARWKMVLGVGFGLSLVLAASALLRPAAPVNELPRAGPKPRAPSPCAAPTFRQLPESKPKPEPEPEPEQEAKTPPRFVLVVDPEERRFREKLGALMNERPLPDPELRRSKALAIAAAFLGLGGSSPPGLEQAAFQAGSEIRDAWKARNEDVLGLPGWLTSEERAENERRIQERYETSKEKASERVTSLLGSELRQVQFRQHLGEWIDAMR